MIGLILLSTSGCAFGAIFLSNASCFLLHCVPLQNRRHSGVPGSMNFARFVVFGIACLLNNSIRRIEECLRLGRDSARLLNQAMLALLDRDAMLLGVLRDDARNRFFGCLFGKEARAKLVG